MLDKVFIISTIVVTSTFAAPPSKSLHKPKKVEKVTLEPRGLRQAPPPQRAREGLENKILEMFGKDGPLALAIFRAESGLRCNAYSPTNDYGIAQINQVHLPKFMGADPFDCDANLRVAKQIYDVQGFGPWVAFTSGAYRKFL